MAAINGGAPALNVLRNKSVMDLVESMRNGLNAPVLETLCKNCPFNPNTNYPGWVNWFLTVLAPRLGSGLLSHLMALRTADGASWSLNFDGVRYRVEMNSHLDTYHEASPWPDNKTNALFAELDPIIFGYIEQCIPAEMVSALTGCFNSGRAALVFLQARYIMLNEEMAVLEFFEKCLQAHKRPSNRNPVSHIAYLESVMEAAKVNLPPGFFPDAFYPRFHTALVYSGCNLPVGHPCYEFLME